MFLTMAMVLACVAQLSAQTNKISDKEIVGVWVMESMQWEGEKKVVCGKASGYTQFKFYGADGEYACAIKDAIIWIDKTTTQGTWMKRHDIWKKQTAMPEKLTRYIVECCKMKNAPDDIQQLLKQNFFK